MTRDDIIRMAREAGLEGYGTPLSAIERFFNIVAAAKDAEHQKALAWQQRSYEREIQLEVEEEREECAQVCDRFQARSVAMEPVDCADAIRARSKT